MYRAQSPEAIGKLSVSTPSFTTEDKSDVKWLKWAANQYGYREE